MLQWILKVGTDLFLINSVHFLNTCQLEKFQIEKFLTTFLDIRNNYDNYTFHCFRLVQRRC